MHQARIGKLAPSESRWELQQEFIAHLEKVWSNVDNGIWEVRGEKLHFTYSKAMAWVAFDRTIKSAERFGLEGPVEHWKKIRDEIHDDVCRLGFDTGLNSFVRSYGSKQLDASLLLLPAIGFLPPGDPRIHGTVAAIERSLVTDGLVRRYNTEAAKDGLPAGEGAFLACSFWLVDAYLMLDRRDDAVRLFERLLSLSNDVGLLSEEYDPYANRLIGNFPQAFSHLALVNSATNLGHTIKPFEQRSERKFAHRHTDSNSTS
jgi:GH15 family glucan-1,4-alpha-glucosidase